MIEVDSVEDNPITITPEQAQIFLTELGYKDSGQWKNLVKYTLASHLARAMVTIALGEKSKDWRALSEEIKRKDKAAFT